MHVARILFVHAHPDDESISTGGWLALLGENAIVLTCTRGELGETVDGSPTEGLGERRELELAAALAELGVAEHHWLGGTERRYRDSGMRWGASGAEPLEDVAPDAFTSAGYGQVLADVRAVVIATRPGVIVSYDERGGYGHPDHVRAGEAALAVADELGLTFAAISADGGVALDVSAVLDRKRAALLAHRSQLVVGDDWFAGANGERETIAATEHYRFVAAGEGPSRG